MFVRIPVLVVAAVTLGFAGPTAAQTQAAQSTAPPTAPPSGESFAPGAEVLSVEGEPLGRLAEVETRAGGERILHIRRTDGSMTAAPATVASRGERAVVLEWTRAEFESAAPRGAPAPDKPQPSPTPPVL
jgi:hypothetical protein